MINPKGYLVPLHLIIKYYYSYAFEHTYIGFTLPAKEVCSLKINSHYLEE